MRVALWAVSLAIAGWCPILARGQTNPLDSPSTAGQGRPTVEVLKRTVLSAGEQVTLHSKLLAEDRTVFVALPAGYGWSGQKYPVLYLTDGQFNFAHSRASAEFLSRNRMIPEMIIVGVTNPDRTRDLYATRADFKRGGRTIPFPKSGNADQFLEFYREGTDSVDPSQLSHLVASHTRRSVCRRELCAPCGAGQAWTL
jgi:hypothetical protein